MKPIELIVRSAKWDRATRTAFRAHLAKNMRDSSRLDYCRRKADFMNRDASVGTKRAALALVNWALKSFPKAEKEQRGYALSTRAQLLSELGKHTESAASERAAGKAMPTFAASSTHEARELLRANGLVATPEILRLERRVLRDPSARSLAAYAVWRHAVAAFCSVARAEPERARRHARKALEIAASGGTSFEQWVKRHRRASVPEVDLRPKETAALVKLAEL